VHKTNTSACNAKNISKDELVLIIQDLEEEMKMASLKLDFESAAKIRDQIQYLEGASN